MSTRIDAPVSERAERKYSLSPTLFTAFVLSIVVLYMARFFQIGSSDLIHHFLLVTELMTHGTVAPDAVTRIGVMADYPPAAHWLAAIIGWIGGSGLVGITIMTVASVFLSYVLILRLVGADSPLRMVLFAAGFWVFRFSLAQVGWEVVVNFFYPQLVADLAYFAVLLWLARNPEDWKQAAAFIVVGALTMWAQPLNAIHIFAAGLVLLAFRAIEAWKAKGRIDGRSAALVVIAVVLVAIALLSNPLFQSMRKNAAHDGWLEFGFSHTTAVAVFCGALGVMSLWRRLFRDGEYVDTVLGSALVAAACLEILQFAMLKLHGDGSAYAVKKHMFLVVTLGIMNAARIIASFAPSFDHRILPAGYVAPLLAAGATFVVLQGYVEPIAPIVSAMSYAQGVAEYQASGSVPGNAVDADVSQPMFARKIITLGALRYPMDASMTQWLTLGDGTPPAAKYAMTLRTPTIDRNCASRFAESGKYVMVARDCLTLYEPNETLSFGIGGNGWMYASSQGWAGAEPWGSWLFGPDGGGITLTLPPSSKGPYELAVDAQAFLAPAHPVQIVSVVVNGEQIAAWKFDATGNDAVRTAAIPENLASAGALHIEFRAPNSVSPAQAGVSGDPRVLAIGIKTITLRGIK